MKRVYTNQILRYLEGNMGTVEHRHNLLPYVLRIQKECKIYNETGCF